MARLELFLFGPPRLERDGVPLQFDTRKILALVAYVAMSDLEAEDGYTSRESLTALLWPDLEPGRARAILRRNLSLLRRALQDEWLVVDRQTVSTDPQAEFWLDVAEFQLLVHGWQSHGHPLEEVCPSCLETLADAVALYQRDFLEGFGLRDSVAYDDWQFFQAEGLRQELAQALERLIQGHCARGDYEAALPHARRRLALDVLHEAAHQQLMQLYAWTGQRSAALRQYEECARILDEELRLEPSPETTALHEQIRTSLPTEGGLIPVPGPEEAARTTAAANTIAGSETMAVVEPAAVTAARMASHNLPAPTTPFVGREEELAQIRARLQEPDCRLLSLLGPGGIGKTRLALELAHDLAETRPASFEHGVFFVSLAPISTVDGLVPAVAEAVGYTFYTETEGRAGARATPRQQLLDYLQRKTLLLVLDNYEHLLLDGPSGNGNSQGDEESDGIGFISDLLSTSPSVKIMATSRISLKVRGEHLYHLAGLQVPDAAILDMAIDEQTLRDYSAVELFVHGAQQVRPNFELRAEDLVHMAHICRLVQGTPLAILLAAAWVEMLAPEEIAREIQHSLDFLETDLRDVPSRQRSIRAAFEYSWQLLDEDEQEMFRGLSVFCGGFTRKAAQEVVGASLRDLMSLVNKSLLLPSSPGRYELHELLRQYGADRLDQVPEQAETVRSRHCAYYAAALEGWADDLKGPRQRQAAAEMDLEIENGRAAWRWAAAHHHVGCLARAVDGIWLYHTWRMRHEEGEAAFRVGAQSLEGAQGDGVLRLRARMLILWSHFSLELGKKDPALETVEQGWALLHELEQVGEDVRSEIALAVFHQARITRYYCTDPLQVKEQYEKGVALYEELDDRWGLARALSALGWIAEHLGNYEWAEELCSQSLAIRRELGDQRGMADAMLNLGIIAWVQGHLDEADSLLRESVGIFRALDDWNRVARALKNMGEVLVRRGLFEDGLATMESSLDIFEDQGYRWGSSVLVPFLAEAHVHLGHYEEARAKAERGVVHSDKAKHVWGVGFSQFAQGLATLAEGKNDLALAAFQASIDAFVRVRHRENRGWVLGPLGLAAQQAGDMTLARQSVVEAIEIGTELGAFMPVLYSLPVAALLLAEGGVVERAVEVYACAMSYPFVANSRWFQDLVAGPLAAAEGRLSMESAAAAQERGRAQDWQAMAATLPAEL